MASIYKTKTNDRHFLFLMDSSTNREIKRWDVTNSSFQASADVKKHYPDSRIVQASKCRYNSIVVTDVTLKGKRAYIKSRYCSDANGNTGVTAEYNHTDKVFTVYRMLNNFME